MLDASNSAVPQRCPDRHSAISPPTPATAMRQAARRARQSEIIVRRTEHRLPRRQAQIVQQRRMPQEPIPRPVGEPPQVRGQAGRDDAKQAEVPGEFPARGIDEVVADDDRNEADPNDRVGEPTGDGRPGQHQPAIGPEPAGVADHPGEEYEPAEAGREGIEFAFFDELSHGWRPADEDTEPASKHRGSGRQTDAAPRQHERQWDAQKPDEQAGLVSRGVEAAAGRGQEQFSGAATAVEDRRFRIAGLEVRIVTGRFAVLVEAFRAEGAVVKVQRMAAGKDGAIIVQGGRIAFGIEEGDREAGLGDNEPRRRDQPERTMAEPIRGHLVHETATLKRRSEPANASRNGGLGASRRSFRLVGTQSACQARSVSKGSICPLPHSAGPSIGTSPGHHTNFELMLTKVWMCGRAR